MSFNVAIDGPAGAGKSTVAKSVAALKNFIYVDTGAMYRAMALYFLRQGIDKTDENAINAVIDKVEITIRYEDGAQQVILNGENVSGLIRTEEVGNMASATSVYKKVREKLVELQKDLAKKADVIMDGRDIGTVVFPDAELKIFVTASAEVRAQRRFDELQAKGMPADFEDILRNVKERDYIDSHRDVAPLRQAEDAVVLDNSEMTVSQQREWLLAKFEDAVERKNNAPAC